MKHFLSHFAVSVAALTATSFAEDVRICMFDVNPSLSSSGPDRTEQRVSPDAARLLLERRLGWPETTSIVGEVDEEVIRELNEFGGQQPILFGNSAESTPDRIRKLLLVLEGVDDKDVTSLPKDLSNDVTISRAPLDFMEGSFVNGLRSQISDGNAGSEHCSYDWSFKDDVNGNIMFESLNDGRCPSKEDILQEPQPTTPNKDGILDILSRSSSAMGFTDHVSTIMRLSSDKTSPIPNEELLSLVSALKTLASDSNLESTLVILPGHSWKSQWDIQPPKQQHQNQRKAYISPESKTRHRNLPRESSAPASLIYQPICYAKNETCMEKTQNCSGHGTCYMKRSSSSSIEGGNDCYACKCARTVVRTNDDGTVKTVQWGGNTCSKKDISTPFFLIGLFSILLVLAISYGVGLLYSIGNEELPSVLSAGVAPTKGQK